MAKISEKMKPLKELRDQQATEVADLERKLADARVRLNAYEKAIAAMEGSPMPAGPGGRRQNNVKKTVMGIINEAAHVGVTANEVVERGAAVGKALQLRSVSSLLSRLKREGTLTFEDGRYRPVTGNEPMPNGASLKVVKSA